MQPRQPTVSCERCGGFDWSVLVARALHPVQVEIVEAMSWIDRPLSAVELVRVFLGEQSLSTVAYHVGRLGALGALKPVGRRRVRGTVEKFYCLVAMPGSDSCEHG
jgi:hypothetical protein